LPHAEADYIRYFPSSAEAQAWGLGLAGAGLALVRPGERYPTGQHPSERLFDWEHGRIIEALQVVLITSGRGILEMADGVVRPIERDTAFIVLPRVWHRYRPDPATGWRESWVEVGGPGVDRLLAQGVFSAAEPVRSGVVASGLEAAISAVHASARHAASGFDPALAALALAVLAGWSKCGRLETAPSAAQRAVAAAERHFSDHFAEPVNIPAVARSLGVGYSQFRKVFQQLTGHSPWQYVLRLRLERARRILVASDITLEMAAADLGFSSAFHLSTSFKAAYGIAPTPWRRQMRCAARAGA
jgi:AraC-like DNA-binding protein